MDVPCLDAHREGNSPTQWDNIPWIYYACRYRGLADSVLKVSIGNPPRQTLEGPATNASHEVSKLDVGPHQHLYCLQIDVVMVQDPSRPPPPQHLWTTAAIRDMVARDAPQCKGVHHPWPRLGHPVFQLPSGALRRALPV